MIIQERFKKMKQGAISFIMRMYIGPHFAQVKQSLYWPITSAFRVLMLNLIRVQRAM